MSVAVLKEKTAKILMNVYIQVTPVLALQMLPVLLVKVICHHCKHCYRYLKPTKLPLSTYSRKEERWKGITFMEENKTYTTYCSATLWLLYIQNTKKRKDCLSRREKSGKKVIGGKC